MGINENRQLARDSLFVLVDLRLDGSDIDHRIKMRNLSSGGMMAEGTVHVARGMVVWVCLRNIGWTEGTVAWVQGSRFGIAFREEIDPKLARVPSAPGVVVDNLLPRHAFAGTARSEGPLRKI